MVPLGAVHRRWSVRLNVVFLERSEILLLAPLRLERLGARRDVKDRTWNGIV